MTSSAANQMPFHLYVVAVSCQQVAGMSAHSPQVRINFWRFIEERRSGVMKEVSVVAYSSHSQRLDCCSHTPCSGRRLGKLNYFLVKNKNQQTHQLLI
jgi:hypothetical protein